MTDPDELASARRRAARLYPRAPSVANAYVAGATVALDGSTSENPYRAEARQTWRTGYRRAWFRGFDSVQENE